MSHTLVEIPNSKTSSIQDSKRILHRYVNQTRSPQIVRIACIHYNMERVVAPGETIEFAAIADACLEIYTSEAVTPLFAEKIPWTDPQHPPQNVRELLDRYAAGERDFRGMSLIQANLSGYNLSEADFSQAELSGADFSRSNLSWAILRGAQLEKANFTRAILQRSNLSHANLSGAVFQGADLRGANLQSANLDLETVDLSDAQLSGVILPNKTRIGRASAR
jgi:Domain of unknown function (DUF1830)/Pentapeptide repeats (8 copies)